MIKRSKEYLVSLVHPTPCVECLRGRLWLALALGAALSMSVGAVYVVIGGLFGVLVHWARRPSKGGLRQRIATLEQMLEGLTGDELEQAELELMNLKYKLREHTHA